MKEYLENLIAEKNINASHVFEIETNSIFGTNFIPLDVVIDAILSAAKSEIKEIRKTLVKIDFCNGDVMHFFKHLATALANR
jgi:hypothetical protein